MSSEKEYASAHNLANQNKQKYDENQANNHRTAMGIKHGFLKPEHAGKSPRELMAIKYGFDKPEIEETKDTTLAQRYQKSKDKNPDKLVTSVGNPSASVGEGLLLNYSKDVAWIQEKLLNLGILSDASYAAEKATGDDYIGSDAIPQTIKAIITYQKEVLAYGSTDGQVTAGGNMETSIGLANLDTVNKKREEYKKGLEAKEKAEREKEEREKRKQEQEKRKEEQLKLLTEKKTDELSVQDYLNQFKDEGVECLAEDLSQYVIHNPKFVNAVFKAKSGYLGMDLDDLSLALVNALGSKLSSIPKTLKTDLYNHLDEGWTTEEEYEAMGKLEGNFQEQESEPKKKEKVKEKKNDNILAAVEFMKKYLGKTYKQQLGEKYRSMMTDESLEYMDCSEFVCRFIKEAGGFDKIPNMNTEVLIDIAKGDKDSEYFEFVNGSNDEGFKEIKPGYVFIWRSGSNGHTGLVEKYDKEKDQVHVMEAIGKWGSAQESLSKGLSNYGKNKVRKSIYSRNGNALAKHDGWRGYLKVKTK